MNNKRKLMSKDDALLERLDKKICIATNEIPVVTIDDIPVELLSVILFLCEPFSFVAQFVSKYWKEVYEKHVILWRGKKDIPRINYSVEVTLPFLKWAYSVQEILTYCSMNRAILYGNLEMVQWLKENGCTWDIWTCAWAARGGHLEVLKWSRENGAPWDEETCAEAARGGHLEVLKWLRENGCPWDEYTCAWAAGGGQLEVLKWLRENGAPWSIYTCRWAAKGGHLEVLKWLKENECPWSIYTCHWAAKGGQLEVLKWLRENGVNKKIA